MLNLYKRKGETPLERLNRLRIEVPKYANITLSYAGRLDPMAEGVLLLMEGDENNEREKYLGFDKTYVSEILFGISTDTHDILGILENVHNKEISEQDIVKKIECSVGTFVQTYPNYSSKTVNGVPLFESARNGDKVEAPKREVTIYSAEVLGFREIGKDELLKSVLSDIDLVKGDFRQEEIKESWKRALWASASKVFKVVKIELRVSSGFYVRAFANDLGNKMGNSAIALSIKRINAGVYSVSDSIV